MLTNEEKLAKLEKAKPLLETVFIGHQFRWKASGNSLMFSCPKPEHGGDKNQSACLFIAPDGEILVKCFKCHNAMHIFRYVQTKTGLDKVATATLLASFGLANYSVPYANKLHNSQILADYMDAAHEALFNSGSAESNCVLSYMESRGISKEIAEQFPLGIPLSNEQIEKLAKDKGYEAEEIRALVKLPMFNDGLLLFGYRTTSGLMVKIKYRNVVDELTRESKQDSTDRKNFRSIAYAASICSGSEVSFFGNIPVLSNVAQNDSDYYAPIGVEGEFDALKAEQTRQKYIAAAENSSQDATQLTLEPRLRFVSFGGGSSLKPAYDMLIAHGLNLLIWPDNDDAGNEYALAVGKNAPMAIILGYGSAKEKDPDEFFERNDFEDCVELLKTSKRYGYDFAACYFGDKIVNAESNVFAHEVNNEAIAYARKINDEVARSKFLDNVSEYTSVDLRQVVADAETFGASNCNTAIASDSPKVAVITQEETSDIGGNFRIHNGYGDLHGTYERKSNKQNSHVFPDDYVKLAPFILTIDHKRKVETLKGIELRTTLKVVKEGGETFFIDAPPNWASRKGYGDLEQILSDKTGLLPSPIPTAMAKLINLAHQMNPKPHVINQPSFPGYSEDLTEFYAVDGFVDSGGFHKWNDGEMKIALDGEGAPAEFSMFRLEPSDAYNEEQAKEIFKDFFTTVANPYVSFMLAVYMFVPIVFPLIKKFFSGYNHFSMYFHGKTGYFKSSLSCAYRSLYGFKLRTSKGFAFSSTANAIEAICYCLKDCIVLWDDYKPSQCNPAQVERIFQNAGDDHGKATMDKERRLRRSYDLRGWILATGEVPLNFNQASTAARIISLELTEPADIQRIKTFVDEENSEDNPKLQGLMCCFIKGVLSREPESLKSIFKQCEIEISTKYAGSNAEHARIINNAVVLYCTWQLMASQFGFENLNINFKRILSGYIRSSSNIVSNEDEGAFFMDTLIEMLNTHLCFLRNDTRKMLDKRFTPPDRSDDNDYVGFILWEENSLFVGIYGNPALAKVKDFSKKSMNRDIKLTAQSVMNLVSRSSKYSQFFVVPDKPGLQFKENTGNRSYYYKFKAEAFDLHVQDGCYGIHR